MWLMPRYDGTNNLISDIGNVTNCVLYSSSFFFFFSFFLGFHFFHSFININILFIYVYLRWKTRGNPEVIYDQ